MLVAALAGVNQRLVDLAARLREHPAVESAVTAMHPRQYQAGDRIECYVDAELRSGSAVGWWLEFGWDDDAWIIESSVRRNAAEGEDALIELPSRRALIDADLADELELAVADLVSTLDRLDLGTL